MASVCFRPTRTRGLNNGYDEVLTYALGRISSEFHRVNCNNHRIFESSVGYTRFDASEFRGKLMAKMTLEMEVDDETMQEVLNSIKSISSLTRATDDLCQDFAYLSKAIESNQREIKKLAVSVTKLLKETKRGNDTGGKG